eukprot:CCRYP_009766-RA/>CCRYP_009766-RA protein AED:0.16 eAED:0.16 QI:0/0.5/0.66/1/0/0/3/1833/234
MALNVESHCNFLGGGFSMSRDDNILGDHGIENDLIFCQAFIKSRGKDFGSHTANGILIFLRQEIAPYITVFISRQFGSIGNHLFQTPLPGSLTRHGIVKIQHQCDIGLGSLGITDAHNTQIERLIGDTKTIDCNTGGRSAGGNSHSVCLGGFVPIFGMRARRVGGETTSLLSANASIRPLLHRREPSSCNAPAAFFGLFVSLDEFARPVEPSLTLSFITPIHLDIHQSINSSPR